MQNNPSSRTAHYIMEMALLAGKVMLENGAERSRVEDTMERIIRHG
ncbi:threonine/serine exporter family protein [Paenibacillus thiaminolyticus]